MVQYTWSLGRHKCIEMIEGRIVPTDAGYGSQGMLSPSQLELAMKRIIGGKADTRLIDKLLLHMDAAAKLDREWRQPSE